MSLETKRFLHRQKEGDQLMITVGLIQQKIDFGDGVKLYKKIQKACREWAEEKAEEEE